MEITIENRPDRTKQRLRGGDLRDMFASATRLVEHNASLINSLNVFPVPDGDTGTNMFLTMQEMIAVAELDNTDSAGDVADALAKGSLVGSRGNSGVILSRFFKGLAIALHGQDDFGATELAQGLVEAQHHAYDAVGNPVEGTMLTVIRLAAVAANESATKGGDIVEVVGVACQAAREALALTPSMLPVLRDAGVVDAGGLGICVILEAMNAYLRNADFQTWDVSPPEPIGIDAASGMVSQSFLDSVEATSFGYCTQFFIESENLDVDSLRQQIQNLGQSAVVVGEPTMVKVHVHTDDPDALLSFGRSVGRVSQVSVDNMDDQRSNFVADQGKRGLQHSGDADSERVSVVAVAGGSGFEQLFREYGSAVLIKGGDTMNPSVQEIVDGVAAMPTSSVIVLPNNKNIIPAAQQASELTEKNVVVVPTSTLPQGIAALLAFNPDLTAVENATAMQRASNEVRTGEICDAVRSVQLDGVTVKLGQKIGLFERKLLVAGDVTSEVLISLLSKSELDDCELLTLYWGGDLTEEDAEMASRKVRQTFPDIEVELVRGGQPHYHFIISLE